MKRHLFSTLVLSAGFLLLSEAVMATTAKCACQCLTTKPNDGSCNPSAPATRDLQEDGEDDVEQCKSFNGTACGEGTGTLVNCYPEYTKEGHNEAPGDILFD